MSMAKLKIRKHSQKAGRVNFMDFLSHLGIHFVIRTDHKACTYIQSKSNGKLSLREQRWLDLLADFDCEIDYLQGRLNVVPDSLSRAHMHNTIAIYTDAACRSSSTSKPRGGASAPASNANVAHLRRAETPCWLSCHHSRSNGLLASTSRTFYPPRRNRNRIVRDRDPQQTFFLSRHPVQRMQSERDPLAACLVGPSPLSTKHNIFYDSSLGICVGVGIGIRKDTYGTL